jgi:LacI family transcriptional regulator
MKVKKREGSYKGNRDGMSNAQDGKSQGSTDSQDQNRSVNLQEEADLHGNIAVQELPKPSLEAYGAMPQGPRKLAPQGKVTLQKIADWLSISTATVSLALRNSPLIAERTRELVRNTADQLGYTHNRSAASLRTAQSNVLAVALQDYGNPHFTSILMSIEQNASVSGKSMMLGSSGDDLARQNQQLATLREHRPEGLIWCPALGTDDNTVQNLRRAHIPVVQVSREIAGSGFDFVGVDNVAGFEMALKHVVELGHSRIGFIGGQENASKGTERLKGYKQALSLFSMPVDAQLIYLGAPTRETGRKGFEQLLSMSDAPTAIICYNDEVALGVMQVASERDLEIGRDVSLIGCNDTADWVGGYSELTTIQTHPEQVGAHAVAMLLKRIQEPNSPIRRTLLAPNLIIRASTGLRRSRS